MKELQFEDVGLQIKVENKLVHVITKFPLIGSLFGFVYTLRERERDKDLEKKKVPFLLYFKIIFFIL